MAKPNIKRVEVAKGDMLAVGVQDLDKQPMGYVSYQLTIYKAGKKMHNEEMKVYGKGKFVIDNTEVEEASEFVDKAKVGV